MNKFPLWYRIASGPAILGAPAASGPGGFGSPIGLLLLLTQAPNIGSFTLEDGSSILLLEDGASELLLEP